MRRTLTLTVSVILALSSIAAIIKYTDKPNSVPVGSDFFSLQRNSDYINASFNQASNVLFTFPYIQGNGTVAGSWIVGGSETIAGSLTLSGPAVVGGLMAVSGVYYGNGGGLTNVPGISGNFFAATNGVGQNPTFYGGGNFFGTYHFDEVDALNGFFTNVFTGITNAVLLSTDGNGQFQPTTYKYSTNIVGAANFVFGKAYWTNITGNFTFPGLTMQDAAAMETMAIWVTNSGGSTFTATINGVAGAPGHVVPAVFYCTNATVTEIDVSHFGVLWTNACVGKN